LKGISYVDWEGWLSIKRAEEERGEHLGKISEKFSTIEEMLSAIPESGE
jgi:hypothetical protein